MESFGFLILLGTVAGIVYGLGRPPFIKKRLNRHQPQPEETHGGTDDRAYTTLPSKSVFELQEIVQASNTHGDRLGMAVTGNDDHPSLPVTFATQGPIMAATLDDHHPSLPVTFATPRPTLRAR